MSIRILFYDYGSFYEPNAGGGGVQRHIHGLACQLILKGDSVRVVSEYGSKSKFPYQVKSSSLLGLSRHIRWSDVVHLHGVRRPRIALAALICLILRRPFFYTFHAYYDREKPVNQPFLSVVKYLLIVCAKQVWDKTIESWVHSKAAGTIVLTPPWLEYMRRRGMPTAKAKVIPNCITFDDLVIHDRIKSRKLEGAPSILSVSRLDPGKRLDDVINAITSPQIQSAVFHIVGKGPDLDRLSNLVKKLQLTSRVIFYGAVSDEQVAAMSAGADVFVLPSSNEGLPTSLIEAIARSTPVVGTNIPGNRAVLDVAKINNHYPVADIGKLTEQILSAQRHQISRETVESVKSRFSWEKRALDLRELYYTASNSKENSTRKSMDN